MTTPSLDPAPPLDPASRTGRAVHARRDALNASLRRAASQGGSVTDLTGATAHVADLARSAEPELSDERLGDLLEALVATAAGLCARGRWVPGSPEVRALHVAPRLAPWLAAGPTPLVAEVVGALVAAAPAVDRGGDPDAWERRVVAAGRAHARHAVAAATTSTPEGLAPVVRDTLVVAAWRSGLARFRDAALAAATRLPAGAAAAALELLAPADAAALERDVLAPHRADRWWWPGHEVAPGVLARHGGFRGLGGPWLTRPVVAGWVDAHDGGPGWLVRADGLRWVVVADVHGSAVVRAGEDAEPPPAEPVRAPAGTRTGLAAVVPWVDTVTGVAPAPDRSAAGAVSLVSRTHSYCVDVVRVPAPGAAA